jgi:UPF0716 family protein affecting phage T7 exclusion
MFLPTSVPPAPPQPHATVIQTASTGLIFVGIVAVLLLLPPVRSALRELTERITDFFYGPPAAPASAETEAKVEQTDSGTSTNSRREIENFDLDLFS